VLFVAVMIAHVYIGTIGMQGPFETMRDGKVDANGAKQHRCVWLAKETAKEQAKPPPQSRMAPAE
jgi:formate dehydrogenase subunit gamma